MKVVIATPLYPPGSLVGAWLTTHEFAAHLARRGHEVVAVQVLNRHRPYDLDGVRVLSGRPALTHALRGAHVMVSHAGDDGSTIRQADMAGVPSVRMVHGRGSSPESLAGASLVVYSSENVAASTDWSGPSIVATPPIDPDRYRVEPGGAVGMVNLSEAKGALVGWWVVRMIGDGRPFVFVKGGYGRQVVQRHDNVEVLDPMPDPRDAYRRMRILLHPSADETYGRVAVEAALSGIPVIAHPTPGTVEALGDAPIYVDREDRVGWLRVVRALDDPDEWASASAKVKARAESLDLLGSLDRFADAVEAVA